MAVDILNPPAAIQGSVPPTRASDVLANPMGVARGRRVNANLIQKQQKKRRLALENVLGLASENQPLF